MRPHPQACGGHVLIVHHSGKDTAKGMCGHSSFRVGPDAKGRMVTTCLVAELQAVPAQEDKPAAPRLPQGKNQRLILDYLSKAIAERPDEPPSDPDIPRGAKGVLHATWLAQFNKRFPKGDREPRRLTQLFQEVVDALVDHSFVRYVAGFYWLSR